MKIYVRTNSGEKVAIHLFSWEESPKDHDDTCSQSKLHSPEENRQQKSSKDINERGTHTLCLWKINPGSDSIKYIPNINSRDYCIMECQRHIIPEEIIYMCFSFLTPEAVIKCSLVCKDWYQWASHNSLWMFFTKEESISNPLFPLKREVHQYINHLQVDRGDLTPQNPSPGSLFVHFKHYFCATKYRLRAIQSIWKEIKSFRPKSMNLTSLQIGCSNKDLDLLEKKIDVENIPFDLRASLMIHNGETSHNAFVTATATGAEHCMLGHVRLLSVQEIEINFKECNLNDLLVYGKTGWISPLQTSKLKLVPVTTLNGTIQYFVDCTSGSVFVRSGWNLYFKSTSWLQFLHQILDISSNYQQLPPLPY